MSNPGPPGEDERALAGPDAGMGLPESGTQHATSTDFALPVDGSSEPDPLTAGTPPPARPTPPAYDDPAELIDPVAPAYDEPTDLLDAIPDVEDSELVAPTPAYDELAAESGFTHRRLRAGRRGRGAGEGQGVRGRAAGGVPRRRAGGRLAGRQAARLVRRRRRGRELRWRTWRVTSRA